MEDVAEYGNQPISYPNSDEIWRNSKQDKVHILLSCDDNSEDKIALYTLINSMIINEKEYNINRLYFHILLKQNKSLINASQYVRSNKKPYLNNIMNYARFCLPNIFKNISFGIYLDIDMVIQDSICTLYDTIKYKSDKNKLWAVNNINANEYFNFMEDPSKLAKFTKIIWKESNYFANNNNINFTLINNLFHPGMMIYDLNIWRNYNFVEQSLELFKFSKKYHIFIEQKPFNFLLRGIINLLYILNNIPIGELNEEWNVLIDCELWNTPNQNGKIIHYQFNFCKLKNDGDLTFDQPIYIKKYVPLRNDTYFRNTRPDAIFHLSNITKLNINNYELIAYILGQCTENENQFNKTLTHFINNKMSDNLLFEIESSQTKNIWKELIPEIGIQYKCEKLWNNIYNKHEFEINANYGFDVWLISTISFNESYSLIPYWIEWYKNLGIKPGNFLLNINLNISCDNLNEFGNMKQYFQNEGIINYRIWTEKYTSTTRTNAELRFRNSISINDYILVADIDEFQDWFHFGIHNIYYFIKNQMIPNNYEYVMGYLIDRMANNASLIDPILLTYPYNNIDIFALFNQYPYLCDFTKRVMKGSVPKITLYKNIYIIQNGRHSLVARYGKYFSKKHGNKMIEWKNEFYGENDDLIWIHMQNKRGDSELRLQHFLLPVHHFKWNSNVVNYLFQRAILYKKLEYSWWIQSYKAAMWLKNNSGKVDLLNIDKFVCYKNWY